MAPAPLSGDLVAAAQARLERARRELDTAERQARAAIPRDKWLAGHPDLLQAARLIDDIPRLQAQLEREWSEYRQTCAARLREKAKACPFAAPGLDEQIALYRRLHQARKAYDSEALLLPLLKEPALDKSLREAITERVASMARARRIADREAYAGTKTWYRYYDKEMVAPEMHWERHSRAILVQLRDLKLQRRARKTAYTRRFRKQIREELVGLKGRIKDTMELFSKATAARSFQPNIDQIILPQTESFVAERTREARAEVDSALTAYKDAKSNWWKGVATHPIAVVVEKLRNISGEDSDMALENLLRLPADYAGINNDGIHDFLRRVRSQFNRTGNLTSPVVIAHIARLLAASEYGTASELLAGFVASDGSPLRSIVDYLRFVASGPLALAGNITYLSLCPADCLLGACYYHGHARGHRSDVATPILLRQSAWDYSSLERVLLASGKQSLRQYQVGGLQPRIAELAFQEVYHRLYGAESARQLVDLNAEMIHTWPSPWRLDNKPTPPQHDWTDKAGKRYDVKSNIFYHAKQRREGLRGFLIPEVKRANAAGGVTFPGFVISSADNASCSWVYIGEYDPTAPIEQPGDRVLPFCFRLPVAARCIQAVKDDEARLGMMLLADGSLRIGWQLAVGRWFPPEHQDQNIPTALLGLVVKRSIREADVTFLEYALWKALTQTTIEACSQYPTESVVSFLVLADELISSRTLPVQLPRVGGKPILSGWINHVLRPLQRNWSDIQCPVCGCRANDLGAITFRFESVTSEGTVLGRMSCGLRNCSPNGRLVTLLTHCHKCKSYPLVIGKNELCKCGGLLCSCGACRRGCHYYP